MNRDTFDFDVGYFIKSPCKDCEQRDFFPGCANDCLILDGIHGVLARCISCSSPSPD